MVTPSKQLIEAIKKQYALTNGHSYDGKDGLRALRARTYQKTKSQITELFETIAVGFGDEGGRNDKLASFVGGLLYRAVDDELVLQLAQIANNNSTSPLPQQEVERTVESMIKKDRR